MLAATIAGVAWRHLSLGLPWFAFKYGGSVLWAVALYWLMVVLFPRLSSPAVTVLALLVAAALEFSRLVHVFPALDAFRLTLPGRLLLGRFFSFRNIAAYWFAIALTAFADDRWLTLRSAVNGKE